MLPFYLFSIFLQTSCNLLQIIDSKLFANHTGQPMSFHFLSNGMEYPFQKDSKYVL